MSDENTIFGELRSIVQDAGDAVQEQRWSQLVATIDQWSDLESFGAEALPYLDDAMAREPWTALERVAPARWLLADHPALALANGLRLKGGGLTSSQQLALITAPRRHALRSVSFDDTSPSAALLRGIASSDQLAQLHTLSLRGCEGIDAGTIEALAEASGLTGLRVLDLSALKLDVNALYPLTHSPLAEQLTALHIQGNYADSRDTLHYIFYELMEKLSTTMARRPSKKSDLVLRAAADEQRLHARQLYKMLEEQLVEWATELNELEDYPIEFESFHDLME